MCFGSLLCMNTTKQCPKCSFMLGNNGLCKISTYCVTFMIPLKQCILPTPDVKIHPQIIIFHLPCSTVLHKYSLFFASLQHCYAFSRHIQINLLNKLTPGHMVQMVWILRRHSVVLKKILSLKLVLELT